MRVHTLIRCAFSAALSLQATLVSAEPENGWWWNPTESGRGYFIETTSGLHYSDNTRLRRERMPARSKSRLRTTSTERSSGRAA